MCTRPVASASAPPQKNITLVPESHLVGRDGQASPGPASVWSICNRFIMCTLCHAARTDARPLVESVFKGR